MSRGSSERSGRDGWGLPSLRWARVRVWLVGACTVLTVGVSAAQAQASTYSTQKTLPFTGLSFPAGVAVDSAGDVFVTDFNNNDVVERTAAGSQLTLPLTGSNPYGVAVDSAGDVFVTDFSADRVVELPVGGSQVTLPFTGLNAPEGVAVDSKGDVFVVDYGNNRVVELPVGGGSQVTLPFTGLSGPEGLAAPAPDGVAVDSAGDVFVADTVNGQILELAADGSQVTLPFAGLNFPEGVAVDSTGDVFVADTGNSRVLELSPVVKSPTITWATPAAIPYGTPLSSTQLDATASVTGTFAYTPAAGTVLHPGTDQALSVTFTPTDTSDYSSATDTVHINVNKATPTVSWGAPASITYGTPLSSAQLDATASAPGSFVYTPPTGTVLGAGANQRLSVTFTPTDTADYNNAGGSAQITVLKAPTKLAAPAVSLGQVTAKLTRSDTGAPVAGETIVFSTGSTRLCSATTNTAGVATCSPSPGNALTALLRGYQANFAGDSNYLSAGASAGP